MRISPGIAGSLVFGWLLSVNVPSRGREATPLDFLHAARQLADNIAFAVEASRAPTVDSLCVVVPLSRATLREVEASTTETFQLRGHAVRLTGLTAVPQWATGTEDQPDRVILRFTFSRDSTLVLPQTRAVSMSGLGDAFAEYQRHRLPLNVRFVRDERAYLPGDDRLPAFAQVAPSPEEEPPAQDAVENRDSVAVAWTSQIPAEYDTTDYRIGPASLVVVELEEAGENAEAVAEIQKAVQQPESSDETVLSVSHVDGETARGADSLPGPRNH